MQIIFYNMVMLTHLEAAGFKLRVQKGISEKQIAQLLSFSKNDPAVNSNTSDPNRFASNEAFLKWNKNQKHIYTLADEQENLVGIIWFGESEKVGIAKGWTFAIRLYPPARGRGIAKQFAEYVLEDFKASVIYQKHKSIWLETSSDNIPALKTYSSLGFVKISKTDNKNKIVMVLD